MQNWKGCYIKKDNKRRRKKDEGPLRRKDHLNMLFTFNQISYYEENDNCEHAKKVFEELTENPGKPINQNDFVGFVTTYLQKFIFLVLMGLDLQQISQWQNLSKENWVMIV